MSSPRFLLKQHALSILPFPLVFCGILVAGMHCPCTINRLFHFVFGMFSHGYSHFLALYWKTILLKSGSPFCIFFRSFEHLSFVLTGPFCFAWEQGPVSNFLGSACSVLFCLLVSMLDHPTCVLLCLSLLNWTFMWHSFLIFCYGTILWFLFFVLGF